MGRRLVTEAEGVTLRLNLSGRSKYGYLGVSKQPDGKFSARLDARRLKGTYIHLGSYDTKVAAAVAVSRHVDELEAAERSAASRS